MVAIDVPLIGDERRKNWAKVVHRVDPEKRSGWAFEGEFVAAGGIQDVPVGSVLLVYGEKGSRANPRIEARVYLVNPDGSLSHQGTAAGRAWARTLRDTVMALLDQDRPSTPDLGSYPDRWLAEELTRRGWRVEPPGR